MKRKITRSSVKRFLKWLWFWKIRKYFEMPLCRWCQRREGKIFVGNSWFCGYCFPGGSFATGAQVGNRPRLLVWMKKGLDWLFKTTIAPQHTLGK